MKIVESDQDRNLETKYAYNPRGEVTSAQRAEGTWSMVPKLAAGGAARYTYDDIGNRVTSSISKLSATLSQATASSEPKQTTTYAVNALNQYTSLTRESPLLRLVQGYMNTFSTVTVAYKNGATWQSVASFGPGQTEFVSELAVTVTTNPVWRQVRVQASRPGAGLNGSAITATREGWLYFPPANESLTYDADGNLTADARWLYSWDARSRLTAMEEKSITGGGPPRKRLEFTYDHLSRRVRKVVRSFAANVTSVNWPVTKDRRFLYDGWNMIAELEAASTVTGTNEPVLYRSYTWGNDLSGTAQGAGGVGGLIEIIEYDVRQGTVVQSGNSRVRYLPCFDLNGNVLAYVSANTGQLANEFDYDAFGRELSADTLIPSSPNAADMEPLPFRFSTQYQDEETGLLYYGYRYYNPELGRWLNRDPIGEQGGVNLYGMVGNDPVNRYDVLGLDGSATSVVNDGQGNPRIQINSCNIVIFIGHNGGVPQGTILNEAYSAGSVITCGGSANGGNWNPATPQIPVPGAPVGSCNSTRVLSPREFHILFDSTWEKSRAHASSICADNKRDKKGGCCQGVQISVNCSVLTLMQRSGFFSSFGSVCDKSATVNRD